MRKKGVTEGTSSYLDWIAKNGVTQFYGPTAIGKSTILKSLRDNWPGSRVLILPGPPNVQREMDMTTGRAKVTLTAPSMERMLSAVGVLLEKLLTEDDLIIVDDTSQFVLENGTSAGNSRAWGHFLRTTRKQKVTVVLGTASRMAMGFPRGRTAGAVGPTSLSYHLDLQYELEEIVRGPEGVVVEVITRKSKVEISGNVKGRLWVRPQHMTPVRST